MKIRFIKIEKGSEAFSGKKNIGKLTNEIDGFGYLEIFDNPVDKPQETIVNMSFVKNWNIPIGTRVYCRNKKNEWFVGRVKDTKEWYNNPKQEQIIQFENKYQAIIVDISLVQQITKTHNINVYTNLIPTVSRRFFLAGSQPNTLNISV